MATSWRESGMLGALLFGALTWPLGSWALQEFPDELPNGGEATCENCHTPDFGDLTPFGVDYQMTFTWNASLATIDSDGDGFSNGWELQDPTGVWSKGQSAPGNAALVANPGVSEDAPPVPVELTPVLLSRTEAAGTNGTEMVSVTNVGGVPFDWALAPDVLWLEPMPASEIGLDAGFADDVVVQFLTTGFPDGAFDGTLQLQIAGIAEEQLPFVDVALTVPEPGALGSALAAVAGLSAVSKRRSRDVRTA